MNGKLFVLIYYHVDPHVLVVMVRLGNKKRLNKQMNERTNERMNEQTNGRTTEQTNERTTEQTNERTNEQAKNRRRSEHPIRILDPRANTNK